MMVCCSALGVCPRAAISRRVPCAHSHLPGGARRGLRGAHRSDAACGAAQEIEVARPPHEAASAVVGRARNNAVDEAAGLREARLANDATEGA